MSCTKNPKKFLFVKYNGSHDAVPSYVSRFGSFSWALYNVSYRCKLCGCSLGNNVVPESDMVAAGFSVEKLHENIGFRFGTSDIGSLK